MRLSLSKFLNTLLLVCDVFLVAVVGERVEGYVNRLGEICSGEKLLRAIDTYHGFAKSLTRFWVGPNVYLSRVQRPL